jgi:hypothetical protein
LCTHILIEKKGLSYTREFFHPRGVEREVWKLIKMNAAERREKFF